ncbi:flagellin [Poriferisphaera sp. WC338]|uniref:flagellin N-terminal helical domain-containing protein n=1 Tax=Poriferisphaera sp. WC338 TaxID=3425129 RepID=UPI003D815EBC
MTRINTNVQSLLSQRILGQQNKSLNTSLERLSTGLRINRGADDPAGLIASENLRSEKASITAAISNAERADQVVNIAEGGLQEINSLLLEVQSLVTQSSNEAGLSTEEKKANQLQIDSILETVDRIASSTSFQGTKLLNGTYDFTISGQNANIESVQVNAAKTAYGENRDVNVLVTQSAQHAGLFLSLDQANIDLNDTNGSFVFEVAGAEGSRQFTFASDTAITDIAKAINTFSDVTGVSAATSGTGIALKSTEYGSDEFVSVKVIEDSDVNVGKATVGVYNLEAKNEDDAEAAVAQTFAALKGSNPIRDSGLDVGAIVNGITATSKGRVVKVTTDHLDTQFQLSETGAQTLGSIGGVNPAFTIDGGGAKFNLGPNVDIINQATLGISNVTVRNLGSLSTGFLDELGSSKGANLENGNLAKAQDIVDSAINQVSSLRGRLGAFQKNTIGSTIRSLGVALENTSAAESSIRDTDFASETAALTRSQILVQSAQQVLSISKAQPQAVLSLLQ